MDKFKWADEYQKRGFKVFSPETVKSLRAIQRKYRVDYRRFFMIAADVEKGAGRPQQTNRIDELLKMIDVIWETIDEMLSTSSITVGEEKMQKLFEYTNEVDEGFRFFSDPKNYSTAMQKRIQLAESQTKIKVSDIANANKDIKQQLLEAGKKQTLGEKLSPYAPQMGALGDFAKNTAYEMLGPFEGIARAGGKAVGGISSMMKARREKKIDLKRQALLQSTLLADEATPEFFGAYESAGNFGKNKFKDTMSDTYGHSSKGFDPNIEPEMARGPYSTRSQRKRSEQSQEMTGQALFTFFHKDWVRASWTRDIYAAITGKGAKTSGIGEDKTQLWKQIAIGVAGAVTAGLAAAGIIKGSIIGRAKSEKEGWLTGELGKKQAMGQNVASYVGTGLGGHGPGIFDKGTVGDKAKNIGWQAALGGSLAGGVATLATLFTGGAAAPSILPAIAWGMGIGGGLGAVGGKKISQGIQGTSRLVTGKDPRTGKGWGEQIPVSTSINSGFEFEGLSKTLEKNTQMMLDGMEKMNKGSIFQGSGVDSKGVDDPITGGINEAWIGLAL